MRSGKFLLPCLTFFTAGRASTGVLTLLMQSTLFLWPTAHRWAREFEEQRAVERMLNELSDTYNTSTHHYRPGKRFRNVSDEHLEPPAFARRSREIQAAV